MLNLTLEASKVYFYRNLKCVYLFIRRDLEKIDRSKKVLKLPLDIISINKSLLVVGWGGVGWGGVGWWKTDYNVSFGARNHKLSF